MSKEMTQEQRLDLLVEEFKADSDEYKNLETPEDNEGKRRVLRSLMNVRMPKELSEEVRVLQDEYLKERVREKGVVAPSDIPTIKEQGSDSSFMENENATYACVNYGEAFCPEEIEDRSICIDGDIVEVLEQ